MTKLLVIGDTHFDSRYEGYLEAQIKTIESLCNAKEYDGIVFLGDIFDKRKPTPEVMLAFNDLLSNIKNKNIHILRGNHDSNTKADDGVTALTLFKSKRVKVYEHYKEIKLFNKYNINFLPHYENENTVLQFLNNMDEEALLFAHTGYSGCINSYGDYDFSITNAAYRNFTILGHIHRNHRLNNIVVMGTPYHTSIQEAEYVPVVGELDLDTRKINYIKVKSGIRYMSFDIDDLEKHKDEIQNPDYYTILRVLVDPLNDDNNPELIKELIDKYSVKWVDKKFKDSYRKDAIIKDVDTFRFILSVDEKIINDYLSNIDIGKFTKDELLAELNKLRNYEVLND